jgi:hypothetical protein
MRFEMEPSQIYPIYVDLAVMPIYISQKRPERNYSLKAGNAFSWATYLTPQRCGDCGIAKVNV